MRNVNGGKIYRPGDFVAEALEDARRLGVVDGRGALTPATSEPSPIFCKLSASSFPVGGSPFAS